MWIFRERKNGKEEKGKTEAVRHHTVRNRHKHVDRQTGRDKIELVWEKERETERERERER